MKYLNEYTNKRQKAAKYYDLLLANSENLQVPFCNSNSTHVYHQYTVKVNKNRNELNEYLLAKNIANAVYYPVPLHLQKAYKKYGYSKGDFSVAEELSMKVLSLPMHTELNQEQLSYITMSVLEYFK